MLEYLLQLLTNPSAVPQLVSWAGYLGLFAIVFAETGLFFGFFLPGDSLLVTAGLFAATGHFSLLLLLLLLSAAAIAGDSVGYWFGHRIGKPLFDRDTRFLRKKHLLRAKAFYEQHGGKTIVLARFVPIVRTFAPIVAGAAEMPYRKFLGFNVVGGLLWVCGMVLVGYFLGTFVPDIEQHILLVIGLIIIASFIPAVVEALRHRRVRTPVPV